MNLKFLETFVWVARLRSFSGAAIKLNATQAAVSSRIKALEDSLGVRLFDRDMRTIVSLTPEGLNALEPAEQLVRFYQQFVANMSNKKAIRGNLTIGTMDALVQAWLPQFITAFQDKFPAVQCRIFVGSSRELIKQLLSGELDICIASAHVLETSAKSTYLGEFEWAWLASPLLDLPDGKVSLREIGKHVVFTFPEGTPSHEETLRLLRSIGVEPRVHTSNSMATIIQLVKHGAGVTLMPLVGLDEIASSGGLRLLNAESPLRSFTYFVSYVERPGDALPKIAVEIAREVAEQFAEK